MHLRRFHFADEFNFGLKIEFEVTDRIDRENIVIRIPIDFCLTLRGKAAKHCGDAIKSNGNTDKRLLR